MLLREVLAWLRYSLTKDPVCVQNGIIVEEIVSPFVALDDRNDGCRTLAIYKIADGFTPRVEVRFTYDRPQVWWMMNGDSSDYISSPYSSHFPGDHRAWTRTEFVCYLIDLAKSKLAFDTTAKLLLIKAGCEADGSLKDQKLKELLDLVRDRKSTIQNMEDLTKWLKSQGTSIDNFTKELPKLLEKGSIEPKDIHLFHKEQDGKPLIPARILKHHLSDPKYSRFLTPTDLEWVESGTKQIRAKLDKILSNFSDGDDLLADLDVDHKALFAQEVGDVLASGKLPLPYLDYLQNADPEESIAPWSLVRRSVLAFEVPKPSQTPLWDSLIAWLDRSQILSSLYDVDDSPELREVLKQHVDQSTLSTVCNPNWVCAAFDSLSVCKSQAEVTKGLQGEFDVWLLNLLHPSTANTSLPVSPAAYAAGRKQDDLYQKVFGSWLGQVRKTADERRQHSVKNLSLALGSFYETVATTWNPELLQEYKPKMPTTAQISEAVKAGKKDDLLNLLVADVEEELGMKLPTQKRDELLQSPFFNSIFREVRFQSVRL